MLPTARPAWLGAVAAAALAAAALRPVDALEIANTSRGRTARLPLAAGEIFSVTSRHSIYGEPFTEEFAAEPDGRLALRAVSSPSAAVREYLGLLGAGERQSVRRVMGEIVFRVAMDGPQTLRLGGRERSFLELGEPGDRLVMRAIRGPALGRWLVTHRERGLE
ncbi:MAG TPA: hypothetical protein VFR85_17170 [Anaeromyxobacteraceae bacterium]|nr:hypothetical protein [Anaeromyxobacteraceae bacterium]